MLHHLRGPGYSTVLIDAPPALLTGPLLTDNMKWQVTQDMSETCLINPHASLSPSRAPDRIVTETRVRRHVNVRSRGATCFSEHHSHNSSVIFFTRYVKRCNIRHRDGAMSAIAILKTNKKKWWSLTLANEHTNFRVQLTLCSATVARH